MLMDAYSVSELTARIKSLLEESLLLRDIWVAGEVSNMTRSASGHWYFTIKDAGAQLKCVMFRSSVNYQRFTPRDGDQIQVHGAIGVYEARGEYQLYADAVQPAGMGDLYAQFEALKAKLAGEGLFDEARKRPVPPSPRKIGVVTSPTTAAFQDVQNILRRRYPLAQVILSPTLVQGAEAPPQIVAAIERLNRWTDVDLIIVCRGGGSIEDLWAFNDERVARSIAASRIPIISGVGHEIDFTLADFAADVRAPTPSAAAELATPNIQEIQQSLAGQMDRLQEAVALVVGERRAQLQSQAHLLRRSSPAVRIRDARQRADERYERLARAQERFLSQWRERLEARRSALEAANPRAILARGYAIVTRSEDGIRVIHESDAKPGTGITIQLAHDELKARVEDKAAHERYKRTLF